MTDSEEPSANAEMTTTTEDHEEPFKLRSYQDEMLDECLNRNSIIALDTGAGKTHIAIARIEAELKRHNDDKLVWFLAPTVALCKQHQVSFETYLPAYQLRLLCGDTEVEMWTEQAIWDAALNNIHVVISTHAVLLEALIHGFVSMSRIALCVFDEAHHCKLNHPANLIMRNFYFPAKKDALPVPHILGLSASPVMNAKIGGLELLEANLDSHTITPKLRRSELARYVHVPELIKLTYEPSSLDEQGAYSSIYQAFRQAFINYDLTKDPYIIDLKSKGDPVSAKRLTQALLRSETYCRDELKCLIKRAGVILQDIGPHAAEWYLRTCSEKVNKGVQQASLLWMPDYSQEEKRYLAGFLNNVIGCHDKIVKASHEVTMKTRVLLEALHAEASPSFTGIVFAEQRSVVAALSETIATHPLTTGLFNIGTFVGSSSSSKRRSTIGDIVKLKDQEQSLNDFRAGKKNLIIATSVLEEGIDISSCQTVICFDTPKNLISFVQRRGRARKVGSKYIMLLAHGDSKGEPTKWDELERKMKDAYTTDLRNARLAAELESQVDFSDRKYQVLSTGALLTTATAKAHLYHFCATLLTSGHFKLKPVFACFEDSDTKLITAEVTLPAAIHSSVRKAQSSGSFKTERAAMADACFQAYVALHKQGLINDNLLPLRKKVSELAGEIQSRPSLVKVSPRLNPWSLSSCTSRWSRSLVQIELGGEQQGSMWMYLPLACPPMSAISLHWSSQLDGIVHISRSLDVDITVVEQASRAMAVLLTTTRAAGHADEVQQDFAAVFEPVGITAQPDILQAADVVVSGSDIDPRDYGLLAVKGQMGRAFMFQEIAPALPDSDQSIAVRVRKFPKKRNFLQKHHQTQKSSKDEAIIELPLSDCTICALPARYAISAACIPSILHCVQEAILARELQQTILAPVGIDDLDLIVEAVTASAANSQRHYERMENLGDAVLKYCTHVQLMAQYPYWPEGYLTHSKSRTNGNASLATAALAAGLDKFIATQAFTGNKWQPPRLSEAFKDASEQVEMSTKTLADVVEALIGAAFINKGLDGVLACIRVFLPGESWFDFNVSHNMLEESVPAAGIHRSELLEELVGHRFRNQNLLLEARTHTSCQNNESASYERLEFLGDAVLDQIVVPELFKHQPPLENHQMHSLRQSLANSHFLGFLCMELNISQERTEVIKDSDAMTEAGGFVLEQSSRTFRLHDFLRCDPSIAEQRRTAVSKYGELRAELSNALHHDGNYPWPLLFTLYPPKMFCDLFEALLGALYIDSHGSLDTCRAFLERCGFMVLMHRFLDEGVIVEHPKEILGKLANSETVTYDTRIVSSVSEAKQFECTAKVGDREVVTVNGCAHDDEAEVKAATQAAMVLEQERADNEKEKRRSEHDMNDLDDGSEHGAEIHDL